MYQKVIFLKENTGYSKNHTDMDHIIKLCKCLADDSYNFLRPVASFYKQKCVILFSMQKSLVAQSL